MGQKWEFRPGEATFRGISFRVSGQPAAVLKLLVKNLGSPVLKITIRDEIDPDRNAEEGCVKDAISSLRGVLRGAFGLGNKVDPIPNRVRGPNGAWELDIEVLSLSVDFPR